MPPCLVVVAIAASVAVAAGDLRVQVSQGSLEGRRMTTWGGRDVRGFLGIPYAQPPIGELRFKPPQPAQPWEGVREAVADAPMCIQRNLYIKAKDYQGQEDCLYLNVYTPSLPESEEKLDVMVWFHGGGWFAGAGVSFIYGPELLLDRDVVLVTTNYRLGALGFLSTEDEASPGNYGLKDQVEALRWVQENIAYFGGNPGSVTIFGESAGGASVHFHMLSPLSTGLFHRGISQSGTALMSWSVSPNARGQAQKLAGLLGCPKEPSEALVGCLAQVPAEKIVATDVHFMEWDMDPMIPFKPSVEKEIPEDEAFLPGHPLELLEEGKFQPVPWISGMTSSDGALKVSRLYEEPRLVEELNEDFNRVAPISLFYRETSPKVDDVSRKLRSFYFGDKDIGNDTIQEAIDMYTDNWFLLGARQAAKLHAEDGRAPVFFYLLSYRGSKSFSALFGDRTREFGVCHADDLLYLFKNNFIYPNVPPTEEDLRMMDIVTTLWTNFAKTGNPTPEKSDLIPVLWEPMTRDHHKYFDIGWDLGMKKDLFEERLKFLESLPLTGADQSCLKEEL